MFALPAGWIVAEQPRRLHSHSAPPESHEIADPVLAGAKRPAARVVMAEAAVAVEVTAEVAAARMAVVEAAASALMSGVSGAPIFLKVLAWSLLRERT